jgi:nucleoside-diphosphate-sugar epimerase
MGAHRIRGDIADPEVVATAVAGCDVVFHVAAKAALWGPREEFERTNVVGTRNVLQACRRHGVAKLVYTSTPSVVHGGGDIEGADESLPYPSRFHADYPRTKAIAEREVLAASSPELATVALRPHLIWGPGDTQLTAQVVARRRAGTLRLVGDGSSLVDTTYIANAVDAHVLAEGRLAPGAACAGRVYFISNGEPRPLREMFNGILEAAGLDPIDRSVPAWLAWTLGAALEAAYRVLPLRGEPVMTRSIASHLATAHWYDISAARRDLGYEPRVSIDEGFRRLKLFFETGGIDGEEPTSI